MKKQTMIKLGAFAVLAAVAALLYINFGEYASLERIKEELASFREYRDNNYALVVAVFFAAYVAITGLSLPGAAVMTLLAGALFGAVAGVVIVSFASSIGATLAFLVARFFLGGSLQAKYADKLQKVNEGIEKEGRFYLFAMRLVPALPFFLVNILMGLTKLPAISFYWVSQLGMFPGTVVYVYAGTELSRIEGLSGILSPGLIAAFVALGLLPIISKKIVAALRNKKQKTEGRG